MNRVDVFMGVVIRIISVGAPMLVSPFYELQPNAEMQLHKKKIGEVRKFEPCPRSPKS